MTQNPGVEEALMKRILVIGLVALAAGGLGTARAQTADASKVTVSAPTMIAAIDAGKMKGDLTRFAWSTDGSAFYFQAVERDTRGNVNLRHYTVDQAAPQPKSMDQEPAWAAAYWTKKSAQSAPGLGSLRISIDQQQRRVSSTAAPTGGDMAKGGTGASGGASGGAGGSSLSDATGAAFGSQNATVVLLKLKGEVIGEFVNAPALPGTTFGWGPAGSGLIVFATSDGRLVLMDAEGRKQEIPGVKAASFPGWSDDGTRLVFLEKTGRRKFNIQAITVTVPRT
jgi:hypothetical protein